jgi:hypothetical protein
MGMTSGWLSKASAERFIIEQRDSIDAMFCPYCVASIFSTKTKFVGSTEVFCIVVKFDDNTEHFLTEADVRFMTGEQSYEI